MLAVEWLSGSSFPTNVALRVNWIWIYQIVLSGCSRLVCPDVDCQGLGKVRLLRAAVRTRDHLRVIGEEVETLLRVNYQLRTVIALKWKKNESGFFLPDSFTSMNHTWQSRNDRACIVNLNIESLFSSFISWIHLSIFLRASFQCEKTNNKHFNTERMIEKIHLSKLKLETLVS